MAASRKKSSMFRRILVPLTLFLLAHAFLSFFALYGSGTPQSLDENAVRILGQIAANRATILENSMVHQWSNLGTQQTILRQDLDRLLEENDSTLDGFFGNRGLQQQLLAEASPTLVSILRSNAVNGAFLVLMDESFSPSAENHLPGLYYRDSDPQKNPSDNSDLSLIRGDAAFAQRLDIPFDIGWTTDFYLDPQDAGTGSDYFYRPYQAVLDYPGVSAQDLSYWSEPFALHSDLASSSYQMLTYTVPLRGPNGRLYGLLGVELSVQYLESLLPAGELKYGSSSQNSYLLVRRDQSGLCHVLVRSGASAQLLSRQSGILQLTPDGSYENFYRIDGLELYGSPACGTLEELSLYNTNAPFSGDRWALLALSSEDQLFGMSASLLTRMGFVILLLLLVGIFLSYVLAAITTRPIRTLADAIRKGGGEHLLACRPGAVQEIGELHRALCVLSEEQKQAEAQLEAEKDRYYAALESSTDILFEYDAKSDVLSLYNVTGRSSTPGEPEQVLENCRAALLEEGYIHPGDQDALPKLLDARVPYKTLVLRVRISPSATDYLWMELKAKALTGGSGELVKVIGSLRDVDEEKKRELRELELQSRDPLTGLYNLEGGLSRIRGSMEAAHRGCLILLDLHGIREVNESLGMVMGDILLEEAARVLLELAGPGDVALRPGGSEFALWLPGRGGAREAEDLAREACARLEMGGSIAVPPLTCTASFALWTRRDGADPAGLMDRAAFALLELRRAPQSQVLDYGGIPGEPETAGASAFALDEIVSLRPITTGIVSLVFTMFDKSSDFGRVMPILLLKVGRQFGLTGAMLLLSDSDFHTNRIAHQWRRDGEKLPDAIVRYPGEEYARCLAAVQSGPVLLSGEAGDGLGRFFHLPEGQAGLAYPVTEGSQHLGSMVFYEPAPGRQWDEAARNSLGEIVRIVAANLGKARSDQASRAKSDFLSRMSHEIRTPMNAIIGMTTIAQESEGITPKVADCLSKIDSSSQYLLGLINDILDMSRIENGKMTLAQTPFSLGEMAEDIRTLVSPLVQRHRQNFSVEADLPHPMVEGDMMRLKQVLVNLLGNAVKFTPEGGHIVLTLRQAIPVPGRCTLYCSVRDDGIGIRPENAERIFRAFEQETGAGVNGAEGTGLGLAISSNLVHMMGDKIHLQSEVGRGSDFSFTIPLPLSQEAGAAAPAEAPAALPESFAGRRILVVEDNLLNTEICQVLLEDKGFAVETAENGQVAVDLFRQSPQGWYDAILMDIRMPVMDGLTATRLIRNLERPDARTAAIIAVSANAFDEDVKRSIENGMDGHISKPIDMEKLARLLADLFCRRK